MRFYVVSYVSAVCDCFLFNHDNSRHNPERHAENILVLKCTELSNTNYGGYWLKSDRACLEHTRAEHCKETDVSVKILGLEIVHLYNWTILGLYRMVFLTCLPVSPILLSSLEMHLISQYYIRCYFKTKTFIKILLLTLFFNYKISIWKP